MRAAERGFVKLWIPTVSPPRPIRVVRIGSAWGGILIKADMDEA